MGLRDLEVDLARLFIWSSIYITWLWLNMYLVSSLSSSSTWYIADPWLETGLRLRPTMNTCFFWVLGESGNGTPPQIPINPHDYIVMKSHFYFTKLSMANWCLYIYTYTHTYIYIYIHIYIYTYTHILIHVKNQASVSDTPILLI